MASTRLPNARCSGSTHQALSSSCGFIKAFAAERRVVGELLPRVFVLPLFLIAVLTASAFSAPLRAQQGVATAYGHLADSVVHLPGGDSLEFQATGPAVVPTSAPGLMITYHPYFSLADTARVRTLALAFFESLLPHLGDTPPFVVLRAVDVPAARRNQGGVYHLNAFGVVLEQHRDGRWYCLHESVPAF
jgi:hypothetical protein